jgi:hypothetical protein
MLAWSLLLMKYNIWVDLLLLLLLLLNLVKINREFILTTNQLADNYHCTIYYFSNFLLYFGLRALRVWLSTRCSFSVVKITRLKLIIIYHSIWCQLSN